MAQMYTPEQVAALSQVRYSLSSFAHRGWDVFGSLHGLLSDAFIFRMHLVYLFLSFSLSLSLTDTHTLSLSIDVSSTPIIRCTFLVLLPFSI